MAHIKSASRHKSPASWKSVATVYLSHWNQLRWCGPQKYCLLQCHHHLLYLFWQHLLHPPKHCPLSPPTSTFLVSSPSTLCTFYLLSLQCQESCVSCLPFLVASQLQWRDIAAHKHKQLRKQPMATQMQWGDEWEEDHWFTSCCCSTKWQRLIFIIDALDPAACPSFLLHKQAHPPNHLQ